MDRRLEILGIEESAAPLGHSYPSEWQVISRDIEADIQALRPTTTLTNIDGFRYVRDDVSMDNIQLTDARTTRVYTLAPSALGGIISIRDVNASGPNTDTWYHYDRLGNVGLTTDSDGDSNGLLWQDAYGNRLSSVSTGQWASAANAEGYGLTTKEFDGDVELHYFWQRWYDPMVGRFVSQAAYPPMTEHPYSYAEENPTKYYDARGLISKEGPVPIEDQLNDCPEDPPCNDPGWCREGPSSGWFHGDAAACYRGPWDGFGSPLPGDSGSQCCYDEDGDLIPPGKPGAGTLDWSSPASLRGPNGECISGPVSTLMHFFDDVLPHLLGSLI